MLTTRASARSLGIAQRLLGLAMFSWIVELPAQNSPPATNCVQLIAAQGTVEIARAGQSIWDLASTNAPYRQLHPGDQLRTKDHSRATVRLSDLTLVQLGPNAHFQVLPADERKPGFGLLRGLLHLLHRDKPDAFYFRTPTASPVIRGTEFDLEVADDGATTLFLFEGDVALSNGLGELRLTSGEAGTVSPGHAPRKAPTLEADNVIQWCLYYPAVINLDELQLGAEAQSQLAASLSAYRRGDLLGALANYPKSRSPVSEREKVYLASLLLAVGGVVETESLLNSIDAHDERATQLARALRVLIAAVKHQPLAMPTRVPLASLLVAESYHRQSMFLLEEALDLARQAVQESPDFAFGWARVAEMEFSFGHVRAARLAARRALALAPHQAQAMAVNGFLLAAQQRIAAALAQFEAAIAADNALGNAWLGRGLCRIRQGQIRDGLDDLQVAAALEPNRALLRSYLGKAFAVAGDGAQSRQELLRSQQLDPNDPTAWLYSALLKQSQNRVNEAIRDLEHSQALNGNRQLYRSRLLLDQDQAVRQANLAAILQDAGLFEQSVRESARAVASEYANSAAHTFLANSFAARADRGYINRRYETAALSEYLLGQMLAPVGGSALSPFVSQQEYTRLFEQRGFRLSSETEYLSQGDWRQRAAQFGVFDRFDYSLDVFYESLNGERANNDQTLRQLSASARAQLTERDALFVQALDTHFESGDTRRYYDPNHAEGFLRIGEEQSPILFAGWHHEWRPGEHTLMLVGRLQDDFELSNPRQFIPTITEFLGAINGQVFPGFSLFTNRQENEFRAWSFEGQHIHQSARNTFVVGARFQDGENETRTELAHDESQTLGQAYPPGTQFAETDLRRASAYAYDQLALCDSLLLVAGVSYDWLSFPANIDLPPISSVQKSSDQFSPKLGVIFQPMTNLTMRCAYTRSLGGLYFDQSVRLEPAQVVGFNQAFRSLIPESLAGIAAGATFETGDFEIAWQPRAGTYFGLGLEWLQSSATREVGLFSWQTIPPSPVVALNTPQRLEFVEKSLAVDVNQLVGRDWALGLRYRVSCGELDQRLTEMPEAAVWQARVEDRGVLHQVQVSAHYSAPGGFFVEAYAIWFAQQSSHHHDTLLPDVVPDEHFWQVNLFAGYRFAKRRAELRLGLLNLADQDYRLNPINSHPWLPRERTLLVNLRFNF